MYPKINPAAFKLNSHYLAAARGMMDPGVNMPIVVTEEGWTTSNWSTSDTAPVALNTQRDFIPRLFTENFLSGISRTYVYNLINEFAGQTDPDNGYGLLNYDGSDKPSMTALRNMISILGEATWNTTTKTWARPNFTPGSLDYSLGGNTANVYQLLM